MSWLSGGYAADRLWALCESFDSSNAVVTVAVASGSMSWVGPVEGVEPSVGEPVGNGVRSCLQQHRAVLTGDDQGR
jgi:hypothetical protein